jgi:D-alanyl-D-alanine endopeptidase (penicillin-binding protein 7)
MLLKAFMLHGLMVISGSITLQATSFQTRPQLRSAAFIVQDQGTGQVLMAKQPEVVMPIASITKLMTAMVVLDARLEMDAPITIEEADKDTLRHSRSRLPMGTTLSRRQALLLALMASENRAAHALARTFPGGLSRLVAAMNEKARNLGLSEARFEDPTGLSEGNVSSAKDLTRLVNAAFQYPQIRAFSTQAQTTFFSGRHQLTFNNTNALVRNPRWRIGLSKTGYIEEGGRCLVMQTRLANRPVLIVLLNSSGRNTRLGDAMRIKQWMEGPEAAPRSAHRRLRVRHHRLGRA